jgi:hypothetical protein
MSSRVDTESLGARAADALYDDNFFEVDAVTRQASETKVMRSRRSKHRRLSEPQSVTSLAEQDPYYLARATALHSSCLSCRVAPPWSAVDTISASRTASDMDVYKHLRTDAQLAQDLIAELSLNPSFKAERTGVEAKNKIVPLDGYMDI